MLSIPTFIINLKSRTDRKQHVLTEFAKHKEFSTHIVEACENKIGAVGLWNSIKLILKTFRNDESEYVLICEDDHQFTQYYSKELLFDSINLAREKDADILLGSVSWFNGAVPVNGTLLWVHDFTGTQFMIVFKKFFESILHADFGPNDTADYKISTLTQLKFSIHPFISVQKDFGYSDATPKNNVTGRVDQLFDNSSEWMQNIKNIASYYDSINQHDKIAPAAYDMLIIPTYAINLPERTERLAHIKKQFENKSEFDLTIIEAIKHKVGAVGLWESIRKIILLAVDADDDVIIICEDDHEFTEHYSKEYLFKNIIEAHSKGINYLSGGASNTENEVLITATGFWVARCLATQFIVLYKNLFQKILDEPFDDTVIADQLLSEITSNKIVLHPFVSVQKDFGYSDVTAVHNDRKEMVQSMFKNAAKKLELIRKAQNKYVLTKNI